MQPALFPLWDAMAPGNFAWAERGTPVQPPLVGPGIGCANEAEFNIWRVCTGSPLAQVGVPASSTASTIMSGAQCGRQCLEPTACSSQALSLVKTRASVCW